MYNFPVIGDKMKNIHKIIFIAVLCIACFSAYSLAQMNQVHNIDYSWNSGKGFVSDNRKYFEQWNSSRYPEYMDFDILTEANKMMIINGSSSIRSIEMPQFDSNNEFLLFATLGEVSNGCSIKIKDMAQRGNIIEVLVDIGQPKLYNFIPYSKSYPYDIVKINRNNLQIKDGLLFIFKDYKGNELYRKHISFDKSLQ